MKETAKEIFNQAVAAVNPYHAVKKHTDSIREIYRNGCFEKLLVIGFGKASVNMAQAIEDTLGEIISDGVIITKHEHANGNKLSKITVFEASHPVPCQDGVIATEKIVRLAEKADEKTLVVTLISGGGSALFIAPGEGVTLSEKQQVTSQLLKAGADISELNCVRKLLSRVKGGRLSKLIWPATNISLILSDVLGDYLDVIASGPTTPDPRTFNDAIAVLEKFGLTEQAPPSVIDFLRTGANGQLTEPPKPLDKVFEKTTNIIIASNRLALDAAKAAAEKAGLKTEIVTSELSGEAREVGAELAHKALELKKQGKDLSPLCLIYGGETTVTVKGAGKGGRNMELALAFAMNVEGASGITFLSAGTDGNDGPTDSAGAIVDGLTVTNARMRGFDPEKYLDNNDSYNFFKENDGLLITGPTGTNVMDIQLIIIR